MSGLASTTHPDPATWYSSADPGFSWTPSVAVAGYSYLIDQTLGTIPSTGITSSIVRFSAGTAMAGQRPWDAASGDLNGDGKADLVVANYAADTVSVLMGNGNGTLQAPVDYSVGSGPHGVCVADLNGDGKPDVAVVNWFDDNISVLLNKGDGTLAAAVSYDLGKGASPSGVTVGDFNGDGKADLAVADYGTNTVSILLGKGDGTFQSPTTVAAGTNPEAVAVGNFNGDTHVDLVTANWGSNDVSVLLGKGDGTFETAVSYPAGANPHGVAVADFNGDGKADLAVNNWSDGTISVLLGNGTGAFATAVNYHAGSVPAQVVVGDFNGDGIPDLASADWDLATAGVLLGRGDGTFMAYRPVSVPTAPHALVTGDFNGDGAPDLAISCNEVGGTTVGLLLNTTSTPFTAAFSGLADGVWYFHVRGIDKTGGAGPTSTVQVRIDTTPPATTDNAPPGWVTHGVTVTLTPNDASSGTTGGQSGTWYRLDGATSYTAGTSVAVSGDGRHTVTYYSKDAAGNAETPHATHVSIDTTAPVTSTNAPHGWIRHAVTVTLTPSDGGSGTTGGLAGTWYKLDRATVFTAGTSARVSSQGVHTLVFYSRDAVGNVEAQHSVKIYIDTTGPTTYASRVTGTHGHALWLRCRVTDNFSSSATSITIIVKNSRAKIVKTIAVGKKATARWFTVKWTPKSSGTYSYAVTARDLAGNPQVKMVRATILVR